MHSVHKIEHNKFAIYDGNKASTGSYNAFKKIKEELSVYYPGVTDDELETMTKKLITFFKLSAKAVLEAKKAENSLNDIDDTKSDTCKK